MVNLHGKNNGAKPSTSFTADFPTGHVCYVHKEVLADDVIPCDTEEGSLHRHLGHLQGIDPGCWLGQLKIE